MFKCFRRWDSEVVTPSGDDGLDAAELASFGLRILSTSEVEGEGEPIDGGATPAFPAPSSPTPPSPLSSSIELYEHFNFAGRVWALDAAVARFSADWDDLVSSCTVTGNMWLLYSEFDFQGEVAIVGPGTYADPWLMGMPNDRLSSVRPFPAPAVTSILLFEGSGFKGAMLHLTGPTDDFRDGGIAFNDKASSAIVLTGTWRVYKHVGFSGESVELTAGQYPSLTIDNALSSAKPV